MNEEEASSIGLEGQSDEGNRSEAPWFLIGMAIIIACVCLFVSVMLPSKYGLASPDTLLNWLQFGGMIARDSLRVLAVAILGGLAAFFIPGVGLRLEKWIFRSPAKWFVWICLIISFVTAAMFSWFLMDASPRIPDESAMLFQARVLASGRLYAPAPPVSEAFDAEFIVDTGSRWYGKYFIGQSLALIPGVWLGIAWLMNPLCSGLAVWLTYVAGRRFLNERVARIATILMVLSPLRLYLGGTMMGHASSLVMLLVAGIALERLVKEPSRWGQALLAGTMLGLAWNARPLTVLAMGGVWAVAVLVRMPWRRVTVSTVLAFAVGFGVWVAVFFGYNKALTGDAFLTPFNKWSKYDRLGFGDDVGLEYGATGDRGHTLRRGVLVDGFFNLNALGMNMTIMGRGALVLMVLAAFSRQWRGRNIILLATALSVMVAYVFHVTSGVHLSQARYWSEALPMMLLLVAGSLLYVRVYLPRLFRAVGYCPGVATGRAAAWLAGVTVFGYCSYLVYVPFLDECGAAVEIGRESVSDRAAKAGIENALVFVKSGSFRTQCHNGVVDVYPPCFNLNDPDLKGSVVYARDLGAERNAKVAKFFPGRKLYWYGKVTSLGEVEFVPLEQVQSLPAP